MANPISLTPITALDSLPTQFPKSLFEDNSIHCTFLKDDFEKTGTSPKDTEGIINNIVNIKGVKLAISVAEMEDQPAFKIGIRSKDDVDAGKFASLFGGGGHFNASGCRIYANLTETMEKLLRASKQILENA